MIHFDCSCVVFLCINNILIMISKLVLIMLLSSSYGLMQTCQPVC